MLLGLDRLIDDGIELTGGGFIGPGYCDAGYNRVCKPIVPDLPSLANEVGGNPFVEVVVCMGTIDLGLAMLNLVDWISGPGGTLLA